MTTIIKVQEPGSLTPVYMQKNVSCFGIYYTVIEDIEVIRNLATAQLKEAGIQPAWYDIPEILHQNLDLYTLCTPIPGVHREQYIALTKLYAKFALGDSKLSNQALEVGTKIFLSPDNLLTFWVFPQTVHGGSIGWDSSDDLYDILTGEKTSVPVLMSKSYRYIGLSHSHNTMALDTPSSIDDRQEIGTPGVYLLHSTFKQPKDSLYPTYKQTVTLTTGSHRVTLTDFIEELSPEEWESSSTFAEAACVAIDIPKPRQYKTKGGLVPISNSYKHNDIDFTYGYDDNYWGPVYASKSDLDTDLHILCSLHELDYEKVSAVIPHLTNNYLQHDKIALIKSWINTGDVNAFDVVAALENY